MEPISDIAARWAVRADAGTLGPDGERELEVWLNADPRHRGAYVRARARLADLDRLAALQGPAGSDEQNTAEPQSPRALSRRRLIAASIAAVAVAGGGLSWMLMRDGPERYASGIGEVRRIPLSDGSTIVLNTATEVTVKLSKTLRDIRLVRGEALFEVAHDKTRPFIVQANGTAVRAVGTAFAVRLEAAQVDVTVTEGVVEVADAKTMAGLGPVTPTASRPNVKRVAAHQRAVIAQASGSAPEVQSIAPPEVARQLAWRDGMVSFDGESLETAVAEINRHNHRQIVIDDPVLAQRPVVGVFRATDLEGFSAAAAAALKARAVADGAVIRLEPLATR